MNSIKQWPISERPREKLLSSGPKSLSDTELLAIFLRTGTQGKTALDLAHELLRELGSLKKLLNANAEFFYQKKGIGKAKLALLKAGAELGRRCIEEPTPLGEKLNNSTRTKQFIASKLKDYSYEVFACLFLDNRHRMIAFEELFRGTLNETSVYPREVVNRGLAHNAAKIILAHNHPSGDPTPSTADYELTHLLKKALRLVAIEVIDHLIVGKNSCISLAETGHI